MGKFVFADPHIPFLFEKVRKLLAHTYLRVEAQNFSNTLFDTDNMSVIRGGSMKLRNAITSVGTLLGTRATRVRVGAEAAVFRMGSADDALVCMKEARQLLAREAPEFTIALATATADTDALGIDKTAAAVRWTQGRSARLVVPAPAKTLEICPLTRVRPADTAFDGEPPILSSSAATRKRDGQDLKQKFYTSEVGPELADGLQLVNDLQELSKAGPYPAIDGKMAVLSMDGNSFGKIGASLKGEDSRHFDQHLKSLRKRLLTRILNFMTESKVLPRERARDGRLRLEVLLWAGDEFQLIVPAWLGVPLLQEVFAETSTWRAGAGADSDPLTLSAGLLICSHKMPIHRALHLAEQIQLRAKSKAKLGPVPVNAWDYLVLESLDYPATMNIDQFWQLRLPPGSAPIPLLACDNYPEKLAVLKRALEEADSRRKVYACAQLIADPDAPHKVETGEWQQSSEGTAVHQAVSALLPTAAAQAPQMAWLHLRELWDYILPRPKKAPAPAEEVR